MAASKSRLGRGLGGLIANANPAAKAAVEAKPSSGAPATSAAAHGPAVITGSRPTAISGTPSFSTSASSNEA